MEVLEGVYFEVKDRKGYAGFGERMKTEEEAYKLIKQLNNREKKDGEEPKQYSVYKTRWKNVFDGDTLVESVTRKESVSVNRVSAIKEITVKDEDIDCVVECALEGGITYWCNKVEVVGEYLGEYASDQVSRGGELIFYDGEDGKTYRLNKEKVIDGIKRAYEEGYGDYGCGQKWVDSNEIECCNVDGPLADVIVQLALFGEVVYG